MRSKIIKYFKCLFVMHRHKEEARVGVELWEAQRKRGGRRKVKIKHIHNIAFDELDSVEVNY